MGNKQDLVSVATVAGRLEAEIQRGMLQAHGIEVWISGESAATAIGLNIGPLGRVEIVVRQEQAVQAREILKEYQDRTGSRVERNR